VTPSEIHCETYEHNGVKHSHFCQWIHEPITVEPNFSKAYQYVVMYPAPYSDGNVTDRYIGGTDPFTSEMSTDEVIKYGDHQLIFLLHVDENNKPISFKNNEYYAVDVYQQVKKDDPSQPTNVLPQSVLKCLDEFVDEEELTLGPVMESSPDKAQEQLGWFVPSQSMVVDTWYKPACKPAVYLYPEKDTIINVQIAINNGFLTYTDPLYPSTGWTVLAKPNGNLHYLHPNAVDSKGMSNYPSGVFPYLYYEAKIYDHMVKKPEKGFVKSYNELYVFFSEILPKLGLNTNETTAFTQYWLKALPKSPYYFIGVIPQTQLDQNEPLTISPKQDTTIRVRLYFEALDKAEIVEEPPITTPSRNGFTVVDWGGMVKVDKTHPFTCIQ
jgi:hypothetical protein